MSSFTLITINKYSKIESKWKGFETDEDAREYWRLKLKPWGHEFVKTKREVDGN